MVDHKRSTVGTISGIFGSSALNYYPGEMCLFLVLSVRYQSKGERGVKHEGDDVHRNIHSGVKRGAKRCSASKSECCGKQSQSPY